MKVTQKTLPYYSYQELGAKKEIFHGLANELKHMNCFLMDLPMHGTNTNNGDSFAEYVKSIKEEVIALKEEGYEKIFTVGHSLGGAIVLKVATEVKDLITGTYLLCGSAKFDSLGEEFLEGLKEGKILLDRVRPGVALVASPINEYDEIVLEDESVFIKDFNIDITVDFEHELNKIETPVGLAVGDKDELILPYMIDTMESEIKDFEKTIYGPVGHMFPFVEKQEVSKLIEDFIIRHSR